MNSKKLIGMVVALIVLAGIALVQKKGDHRHRPASGGNGQTLFQGLDLNTVDALTVSQGSNTVELVKKDGKWLNSSLYNYPVNFKTLADALRKAGEVKMGRPMRTGNVKDSEFGLDKARTVLLQAGGKDAVKLEIGARREASDTAGWANQHFVRKDGAQDIYLVDYDFRPFKETAVDWIEKQILNVRSADVVSVDAGDVHLKQEGADWKLSDLDEAKEEFQTSEANKLRMAMQYLNCQTVADPKLTDEQAGFTNAVVYTAKDKDGLVYTVTLGGEQDGNRYARFAVAYEKPAAPSAPADDASQEDKDAYQKQLDAFNKTADAHQKKAADLNAKLKGWTYLISSGDAGDFMVAREKLVKAKEKPAEETKGEPTAEE